MHFSIDRDVLSGLLTHAFTVVPARAIVPVVHSIKIVASPTALAIETTDLTRTLSLVTTNFHAVHSGTALFPAKRLLEIIREAHRGSLVVRSFEGSGHVESGGTRWTLQLGGGSGFPVIPSTLDGVETALPVLPFLEALESVRYAAAKNTDRIALMMIDVANDRVTACDGVRFQQATLNCEQPIVLRIPIRAVDDLMRLLRGARAENFFVNEFPRQLVFRVGLHQLAANKLTAEYPNLESALLRPALTNKWRLEVSRDELLAAMKRVGVNANQTTFAVNWRLAENRLSLYARDFYGNEAAEQLNVKWTDPDHEITVNQHWITEMLQMYKSDTCTFFLGKDSKKVKSPLLLRDFARGTIGVVQQIQGDSYA